MSTKTLRKRIALVAVSALGTGLLTVVAPSATAANITSSTVSSQSTFTDQVLNVAVIQSTTGAAISNSSTANSNKSYGIVYKDATSSTAQSATMLSNGALSLYTSAATNVSIVVSGGVLTSATASNTTQPTITGSGKTLFLANTSASSATNIAVVWTPGAVGTYTVSQYKSGTNSGDLTASTPTSGTLVGQVLVTVVSTSPAGSLSLPDSTCVTRSSAASGSSDETGSTYVSNGGYRWIYYSLVDSYGDALGTSGSLVVSATNGAYVNLGSTIGSANASSAVTTGSSSVSGYVTVGQAVANAPVTTTVTITYNGTVVCNKTISIGGQASKLTITTKARQDLSGTSWTSSTYGVSGGIFWAQLFDSAGNLVTPTGTSAFSSVTSTLGGTVSAASIATAATGIATSDSTGLWPSVNSLGTVTCGTTAGKQAGLQMTYQNPSGTTITSNSFDVECADNPVTYTASFDKGTYNPGDIAVLTVKFLDSKGNIATGLTTGTTATITTGSALTAITSPSNAQRPALDGTLTYKYNVGTTTGSFNATIDYPTLTAGVATVQIVPYKVADATASVTNAEVLAAIVKLIASINKQISALQKLLTKKK